MTATLVDVDGLPHDQAHNLVVEAVLSAAAALGPTEVHARAALNGRSRIIGRHRPSGYLVGGRPVCSNCDMGDTHDIDFAPIYWPCADYVDAAAGLATGLQEATA